MRKYIVILTILNLIFVCSYGQKYDYVKILPGQGIVFNNDSILLFKTNIKQLCNILNIVDKNPDELIISDWDSFNSETGEPTSGTEYKRKINFKSIVFEFSDDQDAKNLKLRWITVKEDKSLKSYIGNGIEMGVINPKIKEFYPKLEKQDYISENAMTYNLYTYGISFQLEKQINNDLKLVEISAHYKIK